MGVAGGALASGDGRDINVMSGGELDGVFPSGDFVVIECKAPAHAQPCFINEHGNGAMIGVVVERPMGEDDVGVFGFEEAMELSVMRLINDGFGIDLTGEGGTSFEDFAGFGGFSDANRSGIVAGLIGPLAFVQVEENNFVAEIGVASDSATAAVFRVARVTTRDEDFEFAWSGGLRLFGEGRLSGSGGHGEANSERACEPG